MGKIRAWIYGAVITAWAFGMSWVYLMGRRHQKQKGQSDDFENAEDIRRRVSVDRAQRVRELDGAGFRD
jgi:hypothetical protein